MIQAFDLLKSVLRRLEFDVNTTDDSEDSDDSKEEKVEEGEEDEESLKSDEEKE